MLLPAQVEVILYRAPSATRVLKALNSYLFSPVLLAKYLRPTQPPSTNPARRATTAVMPIWRGSSSSSRQCPTKRHAYRATKTNRGGKRASARDSLCCRLPCSLPSPRPRPLDSTAQSPCILLLLCFYRRHPDKVATITSYRTPMPPRPTPCTRVRSPW